MFYRNKKFRISAPTWNDKFQLLDGLYSASDIQDYFEYILKKRDALLGHTRETLADSSPIRLYINKTENKITFKMKTGYYLKLVTPETI